jgi:hypothetical protein
VKQKLKINLFGELWKLSKIELEKQGLDALTSYSTKFKISKAEALLDINFYDRIGIDGIERYEDFKNIFISGILSGVKNQIEIWFAKKKLKNIVLLI